MMNAFFILMMANVEYELKIENYHYEKKKMEDLMVNEFFTEIDGCLCLQ